MVLNRFSAIPWLMESNFGFQFYSRYYPEALRGYEETAKFCKKINDMFDALNRKIPNQGLVPDNDDFKIYNWIQYLCYSTF